MGLKILVYGCDVGGANALGEVIKRLLADYAPHRAELKIFSKGLGYDIWKKRRFPVKKLPERPTIKKLVEWADIVFTATSYPANIEAMLWKTAKILRKPSVALLDFWTHYAERFTNPGNEKVTWPDKIAVIDKTACDGLVSCGAPRRNIEITGQPFLERRMKDFKRRHPIKETGLKGLNIIFVSQPLHKLPSAKKWGYDEFDALGCIVEALNSLVELYNMRPNLIIRTHPREKDKEIKDYMKSSVLKFKWSFDKESDPDKTISRCSFVLGMSSMLLIEAALANKAVVSVQPGLSCLDPFPLSRLGYCERADSPDSLRKYIVEKTKKRNRRRADVPGVDEFCRINLNSCKRVIKILLSYEKGRI